MKSIKNKTNTMILIEKIHNMPIEELLRKLYVEEHMTIEQIADKLNISSGSVYYWLKQADITMRQMKWE